MKGVRMMTDKQSNVEIITNAVVSCAWLMFIYKMFRRII